MFPVDFGLNTLKVKTVTFNLDSQSIPRVRSSLFKFDKDIRHTEYRVFPQHSVEGVIVTAFI